MTSTAPIRLIPLACPRCATAIPANPGEVAWVCETCGQGALIDFQRGARPLAVSFSAALRAGQSGRPFWVSPGQVRFTRRESYKADAQREAQAFWSAPRLFCIPAWETALEELIAQGVALLNQPPALQPGERAPFQPVTTLPDDMHALAEFLVLSVEAARRDALKRVEFQLQLDPPALWVLP